MPKVRKHREFQGVSVVTEQRQWLLVATKRHCFPFTAFTWVYLIAFHICITWHCCYLLDRHSFHCVHFGECSSSVCEADDPFPPHHHFLLTEHLVCSLSSCHLFFSVLFNHISCITNQSLVCGHMFKVCSYHLLVLSMRRQLWQQASLPFTGSGNCSSL